MTREEAINMLHGIRADNLNLDDAYTKDKYEALGMAIKALEQEPILDKIRAELETKYGQCSLIEYHVSCDGYGSTNDMGDVTDMLQIIDKYKAESGAEDGSTK